MRKRIAGILIVLLALFCCGAVSCSGEKEDKPEKPPETYENVENIATKPVFYLLLSILIITVAAATVVLVRDMRKK